MWRRDIEKKPLTSEKIAKNIMMNLDAFAKIKCYLLEPGNPCLFRTDLAVINVTDGQIQVSFKYGCSPENAAKHSIYISNYQRSILIGESFYIAKNRIIYGKEAKEVYRKILFSKMRRAVEQDMWMDSILNGEIPIKPPPTC